RALPSSGGAILRLARAHGWAVDQGSATAFRIVDLRGLPDPPGTHPAIGTEREVDHCPALLRRPHAQVLRLLVVLVGTDVSALGIQHLQLAQGHADLAA